MSLIYVSVSLENLNGHHLLLSSFLSDSHKFDSLSPLHFPMDTNHVSSSILPISSFLFSPLFLLFSLSFIHPSNLTLTITIFLCFYWLWHTSRCKLDLYSSPIILLDLNHYFFLGDIIGIPAWRLIPFRSMSE